MPTCLCYDVSVADALRANTNQSGPGDYPLTPDDVTRLRDDGLQEAALPYLIDRYVSGHRMEPTVDTRRLAISRPDLPGAMFEALAERHHQIARARRIVGLASFPSWENLLVLEVAEEGLRIPDPPADLSAALDLIWWACQTCRVIRDARGGSQVVVVVDDDDSGDLAERREGRMPEFARSALKSAGKTILDWLPGDVRTTVEASRGERARAAARRTEEIREQHARAIDAADRRRDATTELVSELGTQSQVERLAAGLLPDREVADLEDADAFAGTHVEGTHVWHGRLADLSRDVPQISGFSSTEGWRDLGIHVDADTWLLTTPLREIAAQDPDRFRVVSYRKAAGVCHREVKNATRSTSTPYDAHAIVVEAKSRLTGWVARQYTWLLSGRPAESSFPFGDDVRVVVEGEESKLEVTRPEQWSVLFSAFLSESEYEYGSASESRAIQVVLPIRTFRVAADRFARENGQALRDCFVDDPGLIGCLIGVGLVRLDGTSRTLTIRAERRSSISATPATSAPPRADVDTDAVTGADQ